MVNSPLCPICIECPYWDIGCPIEDCPILNGFDPVEEGVKHA